MSFVVRFLLFLSLWVVFSYLFACLIIFNWMSDMVNFTLLDDRCSCIYKLFFNFVLEICSCYITWQWINPFEASFKHLLGGIRVVFRLILPHYWDSTIRIIHVLCILRIFHYGLWEDYSRLCVSSGECSTCFFLMVLSPALDSFPHMMHRSVFRWILKRTLWRSLQLSLNVVLASPVFCLVNSRHHSLFELPSLVFSTRRDY